ncbi:pilus assembly protein [Hydrogenophaga sp.]|uniref:pilus assembly protein n=1 Tax=Hydrogenophaga sp. TaxID=1904254 RepID=UPI00272FFBBE|nr:PilC/PilY family type IV pilus protein [Hydrogenophaga sp.]MDP1686762.1 PilC/PilY family type IV pilus protein [Hydrogenophaga sp.]
MMKPPRSLTALLIAIAHMPAALASPITLSQSPPGSGREPAPNIIISIDDSGSMGVGGMNALKNALNETFKQGNVPDRSVRLAWQSLNSCPAIPHGGGTPHNGASCENKNMMRTLTSEHRASFLKWVNALFAGGNTPTHIVMASAGDYLKRPLDIESVWASDPGKQAAPYLGCRRSYQILMTDGSYNGPSGWPTIPDGHLRRPDTGSKLVLPGEEESNRLVRGGNADGTAVTLPDGVNYDPAAAQSKLYADPWGHANLSSLADLAFYFWSRDPQPTLPNLVRPRWSSSASTENFGTSDKPAVLDKYWNPRNNPASWQHLETYTIGFDPDGDGGVAGASQWNFDPPWRGDNFIGLDPLIRGEMAWPSTFCKTPLGSNGQVPTPHTDGPHYLSQMGNIACDGMYGLPYSNYEVRSNERRVELWHAALNGRGRFIPAHSPQALLDAFRSILGNILVFTTRERVSLAVSSTQLRSNGQAFSASFDSGNWSGDVSAHVLDATTLTPDALPQWRAAPMLDAPALTHDKRLILSHDGTQGSQFLWDELSTGQRGQLRGTGNDDAAKILLNYVRGDRSAEAPGGSLRKRTSRLGHIVNSELWYQGAPLRLNFEHAGHSAFRKIRSSRPPMVHVGANDGMLHAFDAATGAERFAYVPRGVYAGLNNLASTGYSPQYLVDGSPFTADANLAWKTGSTGTETPEWHTLLVGTLAGGGRGYFVIDVTDPEAISKSNVLLDRSFDAAGTADFAGKEDVGHLFGRPVVNSRGLSEQIVKLNNHRWALVIGNGVNSTNERPVLLVQYLEGDRSLRRIVADAATGQGNGLFAARPVDVNGDGTVDVAYAGDLKGNVWKFNLLSSDDAQWGVSTWDGSGQVCGNGSGCLPFYSARDAGAAPQPITTAPTWVPHPLGGLQLLWGTGRKLDAGDTLSTTTQSLYSVWDSSKYVGSNGGWTAKDEGRIAAADGRTRLVQQTMGDVIRYTDPKDVEVVTALKTSSRNKVEYSRTDTVAPRGWYMDLPISGERIDNHPFIYRSNVAVFASMVPAASEGYETCNDPSEGKGSWMNLLDPISGQPPSDIGVIHGDSAHVVKSVSRMATSSDEIQLLSNDPRSTQSSGLNNLGNDENGKSCKTEALCVAQQRLVTLKTGARTDWREAR